MNWCKYFTKFGLNHTCFQFEMSDVSTTMRIFYANGRIVRINRIQDDEDKRYRGAQDPLTNFPPVTFPNLGISPKNFLTFSLTLLPHKCKVSRPYLVPVPNY